MSNFQEQSLFTVNIPALPRYVSGWIQRFNDAMQGLVNRTKWLKDEVANKVDAGDYNPYFKGVHSSLLALSTEHPTAIAGSYALVDTGSESEADFYWFDLDDGWITNGGMSIANTDVLVEGTTNLYFTAARAVAAVSNSISAAIEACLTPTINPQTVTAYSVGTVATDNNGKTYLLMDNAAGNTVTITLSQTLPISIAQANVGVTTLAAGAGVTLNGDLVFTAQHQTKTVIRVSSGVYNVIG